MAFPTTKAVLSVAITGAAGQIGYSLVPLIGKGLMLGANQKVALRLLDIEPAQKSLEGLRMELQDCLFPLLTDVVITSDPAVAFDHADIVILCGAFPRKPGMERKDLLELNAKIFSSQGKSLAEKAEPHCRVLVVGNPANTNALILSANATGFPARQISALTRLDHNRALYQTAAKLQVGIDAVRNVIIWGNHSGTQVPDVNSAIVNGSTLQKGEHAAYFDGEFLKTIQQRGAVVMQARGLSSAASAAKAIVDHVHDWILGTRDGEFVSMAVISDVNPYGVPAGLMFSFPVTCKGGDWSIVPGVTISPGIQGLINATTAELLEERTQAGL